MNETDDQLIHRAYLRSPLWQVKRKEALTHYGYVCARCGNYGSDVHHKSYRRTGGQESIQSDLEVLCRTCHNAHHRVERALKSKSTRQRHQKHPRRKMIHERAVRGYLTQPQKDELKTIFNITSDTDLMFSIINLQKDVCNKAAKMLGCDKVHNNSRKSTR